MKHDLETYERAKDGTKEHTYQWLIQSVRDLLNRESSKVHGYRGVGWCDRKKKEKKVKKVSGLHLLIFH